MTYPIQGGFPNWTSPFTDPTTGRLTRDGTYLLQLLFNRTGSLSGDFIPPITLPTAPVLLDSSADDGDESISLVPGPPGVQGPAGPQGALGPTVVIDVPEPDEPMMRGLSVPGGWYDEKGSGGTYGFAAGVDFVGGTTTTLTLSQPYGSQANLIVTFDGTAQGADQFSLSGKTLTFTSAIPSGVQKVYVKGFLIPQ